MYPAQPTKAANRSKKRDLLIERPITGQEGRAPQAVVWVRCRLGEGAPVDRQAGVAGALPDQAGVGQPFVPEQAQESALV